ncbi:MAG: hypothetical protein ACPGVD_07915 [Flavobacteriales bacterium]
MKLLLNSPLWYILICILLAGLGAYFLYRKDKNLSELSVLWKRVLGALRFLSLFFITFLLLEPLLEYSKTKVEKPILIIAHDNSESMIFNKDSAIFASQIQRKFKELKNNLSTDYEVINYSFGKEVKEGSEFSFGDKQTNLSGFFNEIQNRYYNRNLGGIIIASDGIYNKGSNPVYEVEKLKNIPVYSIAVGDTLPKKDVYIDQLFYNKLAYKGNKFPILVEVKGEQFNGKSVSVELIKSGKVLGKEIITFDSKFSIKKVQFEAEAKNTGLQKYTIRVSRIDGEETYSNNSQTFFVDVLETKQRILLLAYSPHPDIQAVKNALATNENYEVNVNLVSNFNGNLKDYNLVVLHNLPNSEKEISSVLKSSVPKLFVLGNQVNYEVFNKLKVGLNVKGVSDFTESSAYYNSKFGSFNVSSGLSELVSNAPPLQVPFSNTYQLSNKMEVAFYQRIGPVKTKYPVLSFASNENGKTGLLIGEGLWRWKMYDYSENGNTEVFNELILQTAQYLVAKEDKSRFKIEGKTRYEEGDEIVFGAEVYNKSYELITTPEVKIKLKNEENQEFDYVFSTKDDTYSLNAGKLASGIYSYRASTNLDGKIKVKTGEFSVQKVQLESNNTQANHQLLYNISDISGGKLVSLNETNDILESITSNENLVDVIYEEKEIDDLIYLKYLFFFILALLGIEWFVRKRNGGY